MDFVEGGVAFAVMVSTLFISMQPAGAQFGGYRGPFMPPNFMPPNFMPPNLIPPMPPFFKNFTNITCDDVHCGKGNCSSFSNHTQSSNGSSYSYSYSFGYSCSCESGWNQASSTAAFLPCVIPNCTLNHTCSQNTTGPPSLPVIDFSNPTALLDPCSWAVCGAGKCVKISNFTHRCECDPGYKNLLNITMFPCYTECALGPDCKIKGIGFGNSTSRSSTTSLARDPSQTSGSSDRASPQPSSTLPSSASVRSGGPKRGIAALCEVMMPLLLMVYLAVV